MRIPHPLRVRIDVGAGLRSAGIIGGAVLIAISPPPSRPAAIPGVGQRPSARFWRPVTIPPSAVRNPTADPSRPLAPSRGPRGTTPNLSPRGLRILARLVQAEAGNQPFIGQVAVAAVVLNRLATPGFPKTLAQVIYQLGQFQCVVHGAIQVSYHRRAWLAVQAATKGWDPVAHALYYYNPRYIQNRWILGQPVVARIGSQVFAR